VKRRKARTPHAWCALARRLKARGHLTGALDCYEAALVLDPLHGDALVEMGFVLDGQGRHEEALACYARVRERDADWWSLVGVARAQLEQWDEALGCFDQALAGEPSNPAALYNKGKALGLLGRHSEASACYLALLEVVPDHPDGLNNLAIEWTLMDRLDDALACLYRLLREKPRHHHGLANMGLVMARMARHQEAVDYFDRALAVHPDDAVCLNDVGRSLLELGRVDEARIKLGRAARLGFNEARESLRVAGGGTEEGQ
jgi:tetratricopeptide (TPR) repeat protein